ncbi:hypothetical protein B0H66DRAFT_477743 [Apodospora peruviana]|uniref:Apple domain-containing protein n=1 Tax=Apodospora peruviana TaxID=516989 RepID=A0AAE0I619_9PEZI|nr:hypothetical protein B0H66DRAFT_477743 [Apodospora peruviana]
MDKRSNELDARQAGAPCPQSNGTTVGADQKFTLLCNTNVDGDVINRPDAFDFNACLDLCSSFHPKCEGISFNENRCLLKNNIRTDRSRPARRFDAAVAQFPGATSNCPTLGGSQTALSTNFNTMCGTIIAGFDISQNFAPTFQDCMGQCAGTNGCAAISFDASQAQGFKNCYLKTAVTNSSAVAPNLGIDSAMVGTVAAADPGTVAAPPASDPGVATIPVPAPSTAGGGGGAVFFTPPGGTTGVPVPAAPAADPTAGSDAAAAPSAATPAPEAGGDGSLPLTDSLIPSATSVDQNGADSTTPPSSGDGSSNAWIAAPVVGSIAALVLIVLSFIMIKRRRGGRGFGTSSGSSSNNNISRPSPVSSLFTTWLPSPIRSSRSKMMGNFSEVSGTRQPAAATGGLRGSVVGFFKPSGQGMERLDDIEESGEKGNRDSTPVYDLKAGKLELRNSMNGLGQNRWS